ncbi:MAG: L-aspartate oxidase [Hyphomicrobiaceae bacterium]
MAAIAKSDRTLPGSTVVVGGGLAGLFTALQLAPAPVLVVAGAPLGEGASSVWAQGGIAAAVGPGDSPEAHARDTIAAGAGLVDPAIAQIVATEADARVRDLLGYGVPFDRDLAGHLLLSREAAHSANRIVRVQGDRAGAAIMQALIATVRATPSITVLEGYAAEDLLVEDGTVTGLVVTHPDDPAAAYRLTGARAVVLATGGIGGLYAITTNPPHAIGQAIAMAARAGAAIGDAEFVQFHPTAIDIGADPAPLATEALRGEGARLVDATGRRFMADIHPDAELAPRDIVARAVFREIAAGRGAFLDCRAAIGARMPQDYPTVTERCRAAGIDPVTAPIPIAPAEHYHMGGVRTDADGRTLVAGLWAVGECATTSLHGANRLASNSLLEAVVFGARAAAGIAADPVPAGTLALTRTRATHLPDLGARTTAIHLIRETMTARVGVERDGDGLAAALTTLDHIAGHADGDPVIENAVLTARFVTEAARRRRESRGAHARRDFPDLSPGPARRSSMTLRGLDLTTRGGALAALAGTRPGNGR